jgi:hypothetical protein
MKALRLGMALLPRFAARGRAPWLTEPRPPDRRCGHPRLGFATLRPSVWRDRDSTRLPFDDVQ